MALIDEQQKLLERVKGEGFEVDFNPRGDGMCFYASAGHQLCMTAHGVQELLFNYLHDHRYEDNGNDRRDFLCSLDIGGERVPKLWSEALKLLKHSYANAMVIRSVPEILNHKVVIVTVHGSSPDDYVKVFKPKREPYIGTLYFGHTGNHYVALKPLRTENLCGADMNTRQRFQIIHEKSNDGILKILVDYFCQLDRTVWICRWLLENLHPGDIDYIHAMIFPEKYYHHGPGAKNATESDWFQKQGNSHQEVQNICGADMDSRQFFQMIYENADARILKTVVEYLCHRGRAVRICRQLLANLDRDHIDSIYTMVFPAKYYHRGQGPKKATESYCFEVQGNSYQKGQATKNQVGMPFNLEGALPEIIKSQKQTINNLQNQLFQTTVLLEATNSTVTNRRRGGQLVGIGGSALVHGKTVAEKTPILATRKRLKQFEREAGLLEIVSHPSLLKFYGYDRERAKIVTELMDGNLKNLLDRKKGSLTNRDRKRLVSDVALGIMVLHQNRIIHGDLSLKNILFNVLPSSYAEQKEYYYAKVSDLGLAVRYPRECSELERGKQVMGPGRFCRCCQLVELSCA